MGFVAGFAAVVHTALVQSVIPNSIVGRELDVIAAVVLGGANIMGGSGSLLGTCLGVALLAMLGNGVDHGRNVFLLEQRDDRPGNLDRCDDKRDPEEPAGETSGRSHSPITYAPI